MTVGIVIPITINYYHHHLKHCIISYIYNIYIYIKFPWLMVPGWLHYSLYPPNYHHEVGIPIDQPVKKLFQIIEYTHRSPHIPRIFPPYIHISIDPLIPSDIFHAPQVIYFASPAEVLFDESGQLQASKDGLVSVAWSCGMGPGPHGWAMKSWGKFMARN